MSEEIKTPVEYQCPVCGFIATEKYVKTVGLYSCGECGEALVSSYIRIDEPLVPDREESDLAKAIRRARGGDPSVKARRF